MAKPLVEQIELLKQIESRISNTPQGGQTVVRHSLYLKHGGELHGLDKRTFKEHSLHESYWTELREGVRNFV